MVKNSKELLIESEKLKKDNAILHKQLREAKESLDAFKTGNIDALIISHEKALKVYTEETADKPYRILIEKMHEGAITINEDGTILYCNSYFSNMVNLPLQKVIGTVFETYIDVSSKSRFVTLLKKGAIDALKEEVYIYVGDGKKIPVIMTINALLLDNSIVLSIILTDLTIQNVNKELAALSHDLQSPLAGIIELAEILKENFETFENSTVKEMLELIYKSSKDELIMLDYFVEMARIKYASEAFSPAKTDLNQYVEKVFNTLTENAVAKNIHLYNEIEENTNVFADGKMLLSILQNIISNSIKHTRSGGKIAITAKRKEDKIIIEIKDNGIVTSEEKTKPLFTPQMISLSNIKKENNGAGIGLLFAKIFLEKNGGEIWVKSIKGEGSSIYLTLPLKQTINKKDNQTKFNS